MLALTIAAEFCIALMAEKILKNPEVLNDIDPEYAKLWLWHAMEEIEHKSVAYDVYRSVGGCYSERVTVLMVFTVGYSYLTMKNYFYFLRKDKMLFNFRAWKHLLKVCFFKPGVLSQALPHYFHYFRRNFHPWEENNLYLIEKWKSENPDIEKTRDEPKTFALTVTP